MIVAKKQKAVYKEDERVRGVVKGGVEEEGRGRGCIYSRRGEDKCPPS
jgi:hypothetical protein